jgi:HSP20 family protein
MARLPMRRTTRSVVRDPIVQLQNDVNELFDRIFQGWGWYDPRESESLLAPALDIEEDDKHYYVHLEVPGVNIQDISVEVDKGHLIISGEKRNETRTDDRRAHTTERYYGRFYREITLPQDADPEQMSAELNRGVLTVTVAKQASSTRRTIPIQGA